jgi:hypothetical protein
VLTFSVIYCYFTLPFIPSFFIVSTARQPKSFHNQQFQYILLKDQEQKSKSLYWNQTYSFTMPQEGILYETGQMKIFFEVFLCSNSSVSFNYFNDSHFRWTPSPQNFTLFPGESFEETYTLQQSSADKIGTITFLASVLQENSNATVGWNCQVLDDGKVTIFSDYLFVVIPLMIFIVIILGIIIFKSWRVNKKQNR